MRKRSQLSDLSATTEQSTHETFEGESNTRENFAHRRSNLPAIEGLILRLLDESSMRPAKRFDETAGSDMYGCGSTILEG